MGWVDFIWGDDARGIQHVFRQRMLKDGMTHDEVMQLLTNDIIEAIAKGKEIRRQEYRGSVRAVIQHGTAEVVLVKNKGSNAWVLSGWRTSPDAIKAANDTKTATHSPAYSSDEVEGAGDSHTISESEGDSKPKESAVEEQVQVEQEEQETTPESHTEAKTETPRFKKEEYRACQKFCVI